MSKILIVDDDPSFRIFMSELLKLDGHESVLVEDGTRALSFLNGGSKKGSRPDLMIVDFNMSPMGGYELIRQIRSKEEYSRMPILMITGTTKDIQDAVEMEGVRFLSKLSLNEEILEAVRDCFGTAPPSSRPHPSNPTPVSEINTQPGISLPAPKRLPPVPPRNPSTRPHVDPKNLPETMLMDDNMKRLMTHSKTLQSFIEVVPDSADATEEKGMEGSLEGSPMIQLVNGILSEAILRGASDIHIEPKEKELLIRFRIDGSLESAFKLPARLKANVAARIKVMSSLDIAERRMPQDGRFMLRLEEDKQMQFRVSTLPAQYGEKIVLRLLRKGKVETHLSQIFTHPRDLECVQEALKSPVGLILVTGPTGGGKTTTLYTMLEVLNTPNRNILTVEDPIEYEVPGITQVPVKTDIGLTFEKVLRAVLRQDPNVILVGEIRDTDTAEIALKASMTGHLVLSTLHTNYAPMAPSRLVDMGVKPFLIAGALKLVIAQRLVRLLCPACKVKGDLASEDALQLQEEERKTLNQLYLPKGCAQCRGIGYKGRRAVIEVMPVKTHQMRHLMLSSNNPDEMSKQAMAEGMTSLRGGALELVAQGLTSLSEALTIYFTD